ncbi:unnamed protein product [Chironomus riparius]|uniref:Ig-like domain-containing protein n=1 Tax=Chironomus riparius TaxID=315576 RepID=A0A9N9WUG7_9DIPT|nr:unnamed protein product [Chironomus riparius]
MTEIDKIIFKNSVVMLLLFTFTNASKGLRNLTLSVYPEVIRRGQSAQLHCNYEVFDVPLYSVKWYRGIFEFYRYTPFEHPPGKTFFFNTGIKVDLSVSNASHVTLRNVDFNLNGNVSCEVTTESPSFYTATATSVLQVVEEYEWVNVMQAKRTQKMWKKKFTEEIAHAACDTVEPLQRFIEV